MMDSDLPSEMTMECGCEVVIVQKGGLSILNIFPCDEECEDALEFIAWIKSQQNFTQVGVLHMQE